MSTQETYFVKTLAMLLFFKFKLPYDKTTGYLRIIHFNKGSNVTSISSAFFGVLEVKIGKMETFCILHFSPGMQ